MTDGDSITAHGGAARARRPPLTTFVYAVVVSVMRVAGKGGFVAKRRPMRGSEPTAGSPAGDEFAIRLNSIDELFSEFDARPVAERSIRADVIWALLDEWERVRRSDPAELSVYAPASERDALDEGAAVAAIRSSLVKASGPLRRIDPLSRQQKVSLGLGLFFWFASIAASTAIDRVSEGVVAEGISQGLVLVGWVALWPPAERFVAEVAPHVFNRRRFGEFSGIDVRFIWY